MMERTLENLFLYRSLIFHSQTDFSFCRFTNLQYVENVRKQLVKLGNKTHID